MSDEETELYDDQLPTEGTDEGRLLQYVALGVLVILLYATVTLFLAAGVSF
jgi:hypothetical protein